MWNVYILLCGDTSLYIGSTNNLEKRFKTHKQGKGGHYTRSRKVVEMVYQEACGTRSAALKREAFLKKLPRIKKIGLIEEYRKTKH